jgi:hypothetical protein
VTQDVWQKKLQARWPEAEIKRVTGRWRTLRIESENMVVLRTEIARAREEWQMGAMVDHGEA